MQKPFIFVLIIPVIGSALIFQFASLNPAIAYFAGALISSAVMIILNSKQSITSNILMAKQPHYMGNLPYIHEGDVKDLFGQYGPVTSVRLVRDRKTGRRKGFGFVEMSRSGAKKALAKLNEYDFQERTLKVRDTKSQDDDKASS